MRSSSQPRWLAITLVLILACGALFGVSVPAMATDDITVTLTAPQENQTYSGTVEVQATVHCNNQYGIQDIFVGLDDNIIMSGSMALLFALSLIA